MTTTDKIVVGCMSGTSLDGVDAVKLRVRQEDGFYQTDILEYGEKNLLFSIQKELKHLSLGNLSSVQHILKLQLDITKVYIDVIKAFDPNFELIVLHGQTIFHDPPLSWQMINAHQVCAAFNKTCLFDLRAADIARGGQGAPISPLADAIVYQADEERRAVVNLGGFINITKIGPGPQLKQDIQGFDLCICNQWLNQLSQELFQKPYDKDGDFAAQGNIQTELTELFYSHFESQREHKRSLGSKDDQNDLLNKDFLSQYHANDILKSSCQALAKIVIEACSGCDRIILAGGGCKNKALVGCLKNTANAPVQLSDDFGLPIQQREAAHMALLGALCLDQQPITLPHITKCQQTPFLSGTWIYP